MNKKKTVLKILMGFGGASLLTNCGLHYLKSITLDEAKTLLSTALRTIDEFDVTSRTSYSFSVTCAYYDGPLDDERLTEERKIEGRYAYDALSSQPWQTFRVDFSVSDSADSSSSSYLITMASSSTYQISVDGGEMTTFEASEYPALSPYLTYPSDIYKSKTLSLSNIFNEQLAQVGTEGESKSNKLFGYTCLSAGNGDLVTLLESWDFPSLIDIFSYSYAFSSETGQVDSYSSINFIEGHYEQGLMTSFVVGYDSEMDQEMREIETIASHARNIDDSYQVTFSY